MPYSVQSLCLLDFYLIIFKIKIYETIKLSNFLNSCKILYLTLRKECRIMIFENRILMGIFESKRDENEE